MIQPSTRVSRFFDLFACESAEDDVSAIVSHFADPFLFAGPLGIQPVGVADFAAALPKRKALFASLGSQPTELVSVDEQALDTRYVLARTTWRFSFLREENSVEEFHIDSSFLIDTGQPDLREVEFKIVLYLSHQDLMQTLRNRGILKN